MYELVVMRLADMTRQHPSQDNSRVCSRCAAPVGIYPSGQTMLLRKKELKIVCNVCIMKEDGPVIGVPAAPWSEIAQELRDSEELKKQ